jgi:hypothetical protein
MVITINVPSISKCVHATTNSSYFVIVYPHAIVRWCHMIQHILPSAVPLINKSQLCPPPDIPARAKTRILYLVGNQFVHFITRHFVYFWQLNILMFLGSRQLLFESSSYVHVSMCIILNIEQFLALTRICLTNYGGKIK